MLAQRSHSRISGRYFDSSRAGVCAKPECLDASEINDYRCNVYDSADHPEFLEPLYPVIGHEELHTDIGSYDEARAPKRPIETVDVNEFLTDYESAKLIGERLKAVQKYLQDEEMFLANYGDGLSDVPLPAMVETFRQSSAVVSLLLVQPTASFDIVHVDSEKMVSDISALTNTDIWINGGFFVMRNEIFRYIQPATQDQNCQHETEQNQQRAGCSTCRSGRPIPFARDPGSPCRASIR